MRVGGSIGTAILTVILQQHLIQAHNSLSAQGRAFASTFWWVVAITAVAVIPTIALMVIERRQPRVPFPADGGANQPTSHLVEVE
jgi:hypothetical protein